MLTVPLAKAKLDQKNKQTNTEVHMLKYTQVKINSICDVLYIFSGFTIQGQMKAEEERWAVSSDSNPFLMCFSSRSFVALVPLMAWSPSVFTSETSRRSSSQDLVTRQTFNKIIYSVVFQWQSLS